MTADPHGTERCGIGDGPGGLKRGPLTGDAVRYGGFASLGREYFVIGRHQEGVGGGGVGLDGRAVGGEGCESAQARLNSRDQLRGQGRRLLPGDGGVSQGAQIDEAGAKQEDDRQHDENRQQIEAPLASRPAHWGLRDLPTWKM